MENKNFLQPATQSADSLPVGNGRLGACIFGNPIHERIQLNEDSIWDGEQRDRNNPKDEAIPKSASSSSPSSPTTRSPRAISLISRKPVAPPSTSA